MGRQANVAEPFEEVHSSTITFQRTVSVSVSVSVYCFLFVFLIDVLVSETVDIVVEVKLHQRYFYSARVKFYLRSLVFTYRW